MKAEGEIKNRTIFWMGRWSIKSPPPSTTLLVPISVSYIIKASLEYCARQSHVLWIPLLVQFIPSVLLSCPQPTLDNTPKVNIFLMENFMGKFCDLNKFHWPSCPETHTTHPLLVLCLFMTLLLMSCKEIFKQHFCPILWTPAVLRIPFMNVLSCNRNANDDVMGCSTVKWWRWVSDANKNRKSGNFLSDKLIRRYIDRW